MNSLNEKQKKQIATLYSQVGSVRKLSEVLRDQIGGSWGKTKVGELIQDLKATGYIQEFDIDPNSPTLMKAEITKLKDTVKSLMKSKNEFEEIRKSIYNLSQVEANPPDWVLRRKAASKSPGVPTLFMSDFHWGEVVDPAQVNNVNAFNMSIARSRLRTLVERTVNLLKNHMVYPEYPGIIVALGGDMFSGDIHEELSATNEKEIMLLFSDLFGSLAWALEVMADEFGAVFVPVVGGNHSRTTKKPRAKSYHFTNFDYLMGLQLEKHFQNDKRFHFMTPSSADAIYRVYNHKYLLTHGNQFRGGDGVIGPLGPITRGDKKKRSRNSSIDLDYDTMILGHFHQYMHLNRFIVNGSLKGYDEYAYVNNFEYEPPQQGLWITHPEWGITFSMPVRLDSGLSEKSPWVSWNEA